LPSALLVLSGSYVSCSGSHPPRVRPGSKGWGGGSSTTPGHGLKMQEQSGAFPIEELFTVPSWEEFYMNYVRRNRPVVLRGHGKYMKALERWTDDYLVQHWGEREIQVELNKTETRGGQTKEMKLRQFVAEMYKESRAQQLYAIVDFDDDARAKADVDMPEPLRCKEVLPQSLTLWWSSGGTSSVLHQDDAENFLMLIDGSKSVMLVHQDEAQNIYAPIAEAGGSSPVHQLSVDLEVFPRFANVKWLSGTLGAGDTLYIPHTYWHQVNSVGRNLGVNLWWGHKEDWKWWRPFNTKEYDVKKFGREGFPKFESLKERSPEKMQCTPLDKQKNLSDVRFMNDGDFKQYLRNQQVKNAKAKKPKDAQSADGKGRHVDL